MDIREIKDEIRKLEGGETTYSTCSRLAVLYACEKGLEPDHEPHLEPSGYSYANRSEFVSAAMSADSEKMWSVLDEHMEIIKTMFPKEYTHVLRLLNE